MSNYGFTKKRDGYSDLKCIFYMVLRLSLVPFVPDTFFASGTIIFLLVGLPGLAVTVIGLVNLVAQLRLRGESNGSVTLPDDREALLKDGGGGR